MTDQELKDLVASIAVAQKETSLQIERHIERHAKSQKETDRQIQQVNKQLGEIGNKWGTFAEGMAIASIEKILLKDFKIPFLTQNAKKHLNGETIEMDAFAYENSLINTAVIVEIKSHLREDAIEQLETTMANFPKFFPDHADKKLYGMIACIHAPTNLKNVLKKKGIYLAVLHDDIFELHDFQDFTPHDFNQNKKTP